MQATNDKPRQISALLVAALLTVTTFAVTAGAVQLALPGFGDEDEPSAVQSHGADILFNLTNFEQRAPPTHGAWDQSDSAATQTLSQGYATLLVADAGQVGGPVYQDVVFRSDLTAPGVNNNIFGFAFGLTLPTGAGSKIDSYILDWGGAEQTHLGHTKPEGFTLYQISGQLPADTDPDFEDQQFACYWAKNDTNCTSATIDVIAENHAVGTGWVLGGAYELSLRFQEDLVRLHVSGEQFGAGTTVIDAPGSYSAGEFALYDFRQEDVTFSNAGYNDDIAPTLDLVDWCGGGAVVNDWCTERGRFRAQNEVDLGSGVETVECFVDGVSVGDCRTNTNIEDDGVFAVDAVATDAAGNVGINSTSIQVDISPPTFDLVAECGPAGEMAGWCADKVVFNVENLSDTASGVDTVECFVNGAPVDDCVSGNETTGDGTFVIDAVVTDVAGHVATASATLKVDATIPDLSATAECATLMFPEDWCRSHVRLGSNSDALSGIVDSACVLYADHKGGVEVEDVDCGDDFGEDGEYTLYANATSASGHFNETTTTFKIDGTNPIAEFISPEAGVSYLNGEEAPCELICVASGEIEVVVVADDPINNQYNTGIWKVEFWDGVGDNMFKIEDATIEGDGDGGFYNFTWDTTRAPSPSEGHYFQIRTLEVRYWDHAGNFGTIDRDYLVLPPI